MTRSMPLVVATVIGSAVGATAHAQAGPNTWNIDPNHTAAQFAVRHLMVSTVRGQFEKVSGTIEYDGKDVRTLAARITIEAASVNSRVTMRDNDLRSANFFEVDKYPTITFVSKKVEPVDAGHFKLIGDLTMHELAPPRMQTYQSYLSALRDSPSKKVGRMTLASAYDVRLGHLRHPTAGMNGR